MASNKKLGTDFENEFARLLFANGFWVHNLKQSADGQPADLIIGRNERVDLVDCKVASNGYFDFDRIEVNQEEAMKLWLKRVGWEGKFAIKYPQGIVVVNHFAIRQRQHFGGTRLSYKDALEIGFPIDFFIEVYNK